jgi:hypothetical protein
MADEKYNGQITWLVVLDDFLSMLSRESTILWLWTLLISTAEYAPFNFSAVSLPSQHGSRETGRVRGIDQARLPTTTVAMKIAVDRHLSG